MKGTILLLMAAMLAFVTKAHRPGTFGTVDALFFLAFGAAVVVGFFLIWKNNQDEPTH